MKFYSKCHTPVQKAARKVLRIIARLQRYLKAIDPNGLSTDEHQHNHAQQLRMAERIAGAFEDARTDAELQSAMELTMSFASFWGGESHPTTGTIQ
jgi:hypothetical protein